MALTAQTLVEVEIPRGMAPAILQEILDLTHGYPQRQNFGDPTDMVSAFRTRILVTVTTLPQEGPE